MIKRVLFNVSTRIFKKINTLVKPKEIEYIWMGHGEDPFK